MSLTYVAYTGFGLDSANSVQTYSTARALVDLDPAVHIVLPRSPRRRPAARGLPVLYLRKVPLRWLVGERAEAIEHGLFARRVPALARRLGAPVYTRSRPVAERCAAAGLRVILEAHAAADLSPPIAGLACAVVLSPALAEQLGAEGRQGRIEVVPDAFDAAIFHPRDRATARACLGIPAGALVVGYSGLTFAGRGVDRLLAAFERLPRERTPRLLLLGGQPGERERLAPRDPGTVLAPGRRPLEEVAQTLAAADLLVIPDLVNDLAASPLKMFEYAALGIPIVAVDHAALRPILGGEARWVRPGDVADLAAGMADVAAAPDPWRARAESLRLRLRGFDYPARARRILEIARDVAGRGAA